MEPNKVKITAGEKMYIQIIKHRAFIREIMQLMEERNFTIGEAELCTSMLANMVKKNNERLSQATPFAVFED